MSQNLSSAAVVIGALRVEGSCIKGFVAIGYLPTSLGLIGYSILNWVFQILVLGFHYPSES